MMPWVLPFCAAGLALAGCTASSGPSPYGGVEGVRTYMYYDANHLGTPIGQPSEQAIYNINHGTWLWPPTSATTKGPN